MKKKGKRKIKKLDKVIEELRYRIYRNYQWCSHNGLEPTPYMEGVNDVCRKMIKVVKKLKKEKRKK